MGLSALLLSACLLATPATAGQSPLDLWASGQRSEAVEAERVRLNTATASASDWKRLAQWQLEIHQPKAALESAERGGESCRSERGAALFRLTRYAESIPFLQEDTLLEVLMLLDAQEAVQRFQDADAVLSRALERFGRLDARLLAADGRRWARQENWTRAVEAFQAALKLDPCEAEAQLGLGRALLRSGDRQGGLTAMQRHRELRAQLDVLDHALRGVDLQPMHGPNWTAVGEAEAGLGRVTRALAAYEHAERLCDERQLVPNALRHSRLLWETQGDPQAALRVLERAEQRCGDPRLPVRRADILAGTGRAREAIELLEALARSRPHDEALVERLKKVRAQAAPEAR